MTCGKYVLHPIWLIKSSGSHKWNSWLVKKRKKKLWYVFTTMLSPLWLMLNRQYAAHITLFLWSQRKKNPDNQQALLSVNLDEGYDFKEELLCSLPALYFCSGSSVEELFMIHGSKDFSAHSSYTGPLCCTSLYPLKLSPFAPSDSKLPKASWGGSADVWIATRAPLVIFCG